MALHIAVFDILAFSGLILGIIETIPPLHVWEDMEWTGQGFENQQWCLE